ncbi:MAG: hypothetical protein Q8K12_10830 [Thiobacillus sp.]|nr:hypothetical protein [Thiobacillus sp.]
MIETDRLIAPAAVSPVEEQIEHVLLFGSLGLDNALECLKEICHH